MVVVGLRRPGCGAHASVSSLPPQGPAPGRTAHRPEEHRMPRRPRPIARLLAVFCLALLTVAILGGTGRASASPQQPPPPPPNRQQPPPPPPPADRPLRVFIDCTNAYCDTEFFRAEMAFVDHVRDRRDADVHVLVTGDDTGGGGREYTFAFLGLGRFDKVNHTLRCVTKSTDTDDERRREMLTTLKLGLVRYVADTPAGRHLQIGFRRPAASGADATARDPWNHWVFSANLRGSTSGESSQTSVSLYGGFSANRVTEAWRVLTSASANYSESDYTFSEGDTYTSISRSFYGSALIVRSLGRHWGAGMDAGFSSSTYSNYQARVRVAPAVEYNVFPYSESTRHQLTVNYGVGATRVRYFEQTIYGKDRQTLADHALTVYLDMRQPWGSTSTAFSVSQYLNDLSKNRVQLYGDMDVRLFKGFSLTAYGSVSRIHDQLNLPMGAATTEEVLVRQRQLATSYSYYVSMGISYRFGSIFNNVVNSRFNGVRQMY
jgi:hypothetical protein